MDNHEPSPVSGDAPAPYPRLRSVFDSTRHVLMALPRYRVEHIPHGLPTMHMTSRYDWMRLCTVYERETTKNYQMVHTQIPEDQYQDHLWWRQNCAHLDVHPAVLTVIDDGWTPKGGTERIALEAPRFSDDGTRLSYVQSDEKGRRGTWTVTSPGKYIKARWPYLKDDYIRDVVARTAVQAPQILYRSADFVDAAVNGPGSCMSWGEGECGFDPDEPSTHPYYVYDHKLGWRIAVRKDGDGRIVSRTIILHPSRGPFTDGETLQGAVFVRSYKRGDSYSHSDNEVEAWLVGQGAQKLDGWPLGAKLRKVDHPDDSEYDFMVPYIDGDNHYVDDRGVHLVISCHGEFECRRTDGRYDDGEERVECAHCGRMVRSDGGIWVGYHEDEFVGECCSDEYVWGRGSNGRWYHYLGDYNVEVDGEHYHEDYLSDNDIVELADGDYEHMDNAFCCPVRDEWYHIDEGVHTEDEGHVHTDETWICYATNEVYSTNITPVVIDGETYHPDNAPDEDENDFDLPYEKPEGSISNDSQIPLVEVTPAELSPAAHDLVKVYQHQSVATALYRAGRNGRIDVLHLNETRAGWHYGVGEPNEWLTDGQRRYVEVPHECRRFKHINGGDTVYRFDPTADSLRGFFQMVGTDEWQECTANGASMTNGLNGFYEIAPDLSFTLTPELEIA